ncbi:hypothetical protein ACFPC0_10925 [Streptomyces andamanensis]|uniref:Uncharacterized protein n=1 Tax=Streptomyces andamanensis TaxID=1565035 RepID=A0ABV8TCV6_9ACTN
MAAPTTTTDEVIPAQIDKGNLIPKTYTGTLQTFVMLGPDQLTVASGAVFTDGRIVVSTPSGQTLQRYANMPALIEDWWGQGMLMWCPHDTLLDYEVAPRRFVFERHEDETGISGTGTALEGVVFPHGGVHLMWLGTVRSLVEWPSIEEALAMHGHDGRTQIRWLDPA